MAFGATINRKQGLIYDLSDSRFPTPSSAMSIYGAGTFGTVNLGASIYYAGAKTEDKYSSSDSLSKSAVTAFNIGFDADKVEISFGIGINSLEAKAESGSTERSFSMTGGTEYRAGARFFIPMSEKVDLVPSFKIRGNSYSYEMNSGATTLEMPENTEMYLSIGTGINAKISDRGFLNFGLAFNMQKEESKDEDETITETTTSLPGVNLSGKLNVLKLSDSSSKIPLDIDVLAGAQKSFLSYKEEYSSGSYSYERSRSIGAGSSILSFGLSFRLKGIKVDCCLNKDNLFTGSYLFRGIKTIFIPPCLYFMSSD
jgi:hypothetical protein